MRSIPFSLPGLKRYDPDEPVTVARAIDLGFYTEAISTPPHRDFILWHDEIIRDEDGREIPKIKPMPNIPWSEISWDERLEQVRAGMRDHESKVPEQTRDTQTAAGLALRHVPRPLPTSGGSTSPRILDLLARACAHND